MDYFIIKSFLPEIFLSSCILIQLVFNSFLTKNTRLNFVLIEKEATFQTYFILFCLILFFSNNHLQAYFSNFFFTTERAVCLIKLWTTCVSILLIPYIVVNFKNHKLSIVEYFSVFLISLLSTFLIASAYDLLSIYLTIEMQALCFYIMTAFKRKSAFSVEAGLKYFLTGSLMSGLFLLSSSVIFGLLGSLNLHNLISLLNIFFSGDYILFYASISLGTILITCVLLFKISAFPFHFWTPDVYEGAPFASTLIFSIVPKLSIFYLFFKWFLYAETCFAINNLMLWSGLFSIYVGSFMALLQKRIKRLLIYSSIAQTGFLLAGMSNFNFESFSYVYFFLISYIMTSFLTWGSLSLLFFFNHQCRLFNHISCSPLFLINLNLFFQSNKSWSLIYLGTFFSLAGIPPLIGFFAKFLIIASLMQNLYIVPAFIFFMISLISTFYYIRVIKILFFETTTSLNLKDNQAIFEFGLLHLTCLQLAFFTFCTIYFFCYPITILKVSYFLTTLFFYF